MTSEKKKKTAEEIGIKIQTEQKLYEQSLQETKDGIRERERQLNEIVDKHRDIEADFNQRTENFKQQEVIRLGRILEKSGLVEREHISAKLKRDLEGYIHRSTIYLAAFKEWKDSAYVNKNATGVNQYTTSGVSPDEEQFTQIEKEYAESGKIDIEKDEHIDYLIEYLTGLNTREQADIKNNTPKGTDWRNILIDQSKNHRLRLRKQLTDTRIIMLLHDLRTLNRLGTLFTTELYEEQEMRKKHAGLHSK